MYRIIKSLPIIIFLVLSFIWSYRYHISICYKFPSREEGGTRAGRVRRPCRVPFPFSKNVSPHSPYWISREKQTASSLSTFPCFFGILKIHWGSFRDHFGGWHIPSPPWVRMSVSQTRGSRAWFPLGKIFGSSAKKMDFRFRNLCFFIFLTFSVIISPGEYYHVTIFAEITAIILVIDRAESERIRS